MIEWIDVNKIKSDLRRIRDSNSLKKIEEKLANMEIKKKIIQEKKSIVEFVSNYIIEPYRKSKFLPNVGSQIYIDKYTNEEENGDYMMGKAKDKYFISYSKNCSTRLAIFEIESKDIGNGMIARGFNVYTVSLGWFLIPSINSVENYYIPSVIYDDKNNTTDSNKEYYKLLDKARSIDDRMKRYSSAVSKK